MAGAVPTRSSIEARAASIDVTLCDLCGVLRMTDPDMAGREANSLIAYQILELRKEVGRMAAEHRELFNGVNERLQELELKDARSDGALAGAKSTLIFVSSLSTILGGFVGWAIKTFTGGK